MPPSETGSEGVAAPEGARERVAHDPGEPALVRLRSEGSILTGLGGARTRREEAKMSLRDGEGAGEQGEEEDEGGKGSVGGPPSSERAGGVSGSAGWEGEGGEATE